MTIEQSKANQEAQVNMFRFGIWLVLFVVLLGSSVRYFTDVFDSVEQTEADTAVQVFAASVVSIHRDWILQGRPDRVAISGVNAQGKATGRWIFVMNRFGWPIQVVGAGKKPVCEALWQALQKSDRLEFSGQLMRFRLNQLDSQRPSQLNSRSGDEDRLNIQACRNTVAGQVNFTYRFDTGKVELRP
ncbi:MAG: hypothetical protein ACI8WB_001890 [Phenylobacterium sp.]|jgi:hypothetical protein